MAAGLFHRHNRDTNNADDGTTAAVDRERAAGYEQQAADDRMRAAEATTRTQRVVAADRAAAEERAADDSRAAAADRAGLGGRSVGQMRHPLATDQPVPPGGAVAPPATGRATAATERDRETTEAERDAERTPRWAHTSFSATLSLIIGVSAVYAALSGRLAPVAVVLGVIGVLFAGPALAAVSRKHVTGHHVALLGLLFSIVGVVFGILAINKSVPWLNGDADQAGQLRDWLNSHWTWLKRW